MDARARLRAALQEAAGLAAADGDLPALRLVGEVLERLLALPPPGGSAEPPAGGGVVPITAARRRRP